MVLCGALRCCEQRMREKASSPLSVKETATSAMIHQHGNEGEMR